MALVTYGLRRRKFLRYSVTGASQDNFPAETSVPSAAAVNALVFDPIVNKVSASTGAGFP